MLFKRNEGGASSLGLGLTRSGSVRPIDERESRALGPVSEGPTPEGFEPDKKPIKDLTLGGMWQRTLSHLFGSKRCDLRMLLGVLGAPLAPVPVQYMDDCMSSPIETDNIETSSAQYIMKQYVAATGGPKLQSSMQNFFAAGKVKMIAAEYETSNKLVRPRGNAEAGEVGWFNVWQTNDNLWSVDVELEADGHKVHVSAGCDGNLVWRHTPWLGAHASKGPARPLRRALQGLDPRTTAAMFGTSKCVGEKNIEGEDCFILKLKTDPDTLACRSAGPAEVIRHVLCGYFSQKTGLLVRIEDSHLTRIQNHGEDTVYWETSIESTLEDYRNVDGMLIAHGGHSVVTLFRFGEVALSQTKSRMEEVWTITEMAFNVKGVNAEFFLPPADIRANPISEALEFPAGRRGRGGFGRSSGNNDSVIWRVEV